VKKVEEKAQKLIDKKEAVYSRECSLAEAKEINGIIPTSFF
jgi:hypothetical protein